MTSAKRSATIYSGLVNEWPGFKVSAKSVLRDLGMGFVITGGTMPAMTKYNMTQASTGTTAAGTYTAKEIVEQVRSGTIAKPNDCIVSAVGSTDSHQLLNVLARFAIEAETDMAIDSYDTIVKMISNETEDGQRVAASD